MATKKNAEDHRHGGDRKLAKHITETTKADHQQQIEIASRQGIDADKGNHRDARQQHRRRHLQNAAEHPHQRHIQDQQNNIGNQQRSDQTPDHLRPFGEQKRSGRDVERHQQRQQHRRRSRPRHTKRQHRHQCAAGRSIVASLGCGNTFRLTGTKAALVAGRRFLKHIGKEASQRGTSPRQQPGDKADAGAAKHRPSAIHDVLHRNADFLELHANG